MIQFDVNYLQTAQADFPSTAPTDDATKCLAQPGRVHQFQINVASAEELLKSLLLPLRRQRHSDPCEVTDPNAILDQPMMLKNKMTFIQPMMWAKFSLWSPKGKEHCAPR